MALIPSVSPTSSSRRSMSAADRRRQILDAAAELFARNGYAATRTRAIAEACGVSEAMVFRHFPSKEELFLEVLDDRTERENIPGFLAGLDPELPVEDVFVAVAREILRVGREDPVIHPLLVSASVAGTEGTHGAYVAWRLPFVNHLEEVIHDRIAKGVFRPDVNPRLSARAFVGMVMDCVLSCGLWKDLGYSEHTPDDMVANNVPTFVRGLLAPEAGHKG